MEGECSHCRTHRLTLMVFMILDWQCLVFAHSAFSLLVLHTVIDYMRVLKSLFHSRLLFSLLRLLFWINFHVTHDAYLCGTSNSLGVEHFFRLQFVRFCNLLEINGSEVHHIGL